MQYTELLHTLAEISIGILGFTGVVLALKHQSVEWTSRERILFQTLVSTALTAIMGCFLPEVISMVISSGDEIWRYSNLLFALFHITNIVVATTFIKKYGFTSTLADKVNAFTGLLTLTLNFLTFFQIIPVPELILFIAILQQLYIAMGNFLRLVGY